MPDDYITRSEYEARNTEIRNDIVRMEGKIDGITNSLNQQNTDKLKFIANSFITLLAGGGITAIIELLRK